MVPVRGMGLLVPDQRGQSVAENKFDAFVVVAKSVPEAGILPGLGLLAGGMFLSSSCKKPN